MVTTTTGLATSFITFTRTSNATVTDSNGFIKWAGHNLLTNSESFDASAWSKTHGTSATPVVTANAAAAPNGTTTADRVDFGAIDAAGDYSVMYQTFTALDTSYTAGVWVKALAAGDVGKKVWLYLFDTANRGQITITLTADWQYVSTTATLTSGTRSFYLSTLGSDFGGSNQAAASVLVWGAHLYRSDLGGMVLNPARGDAYYPTTPRNLLGYTESLTTGWTNSNTTDSIVTETNPNGLASSVEVTATAGNGTLLGSLSLLASPYTFSIWLKRKTGTGTVEITVDGTTYVAAAVTGTWTRFSTTLTPTAGTKTPGIRLVTSGDAVFAWGAQLSDSASLDAYSPVYDAAVTSAAYYAPRLDYDPVTLAAKGLLVEEQRSNLLTYSSEFNNAAWVDLTNATISANATTAPDGTSTADKLVSANVTDNVNVGRNNVTLVSSKIYTVSVYIKADGARYVQITTNSTTSLSHANFDLNTGTVTAGSNNGATITPAGNGWYRCSMTFTSLNTLGGPYFSLQDSGTAARGGTYTGNGTSGVFLYGAQLEIGASNADAPFPTSFIPTIGNTTATRTADVASVSTQAFPYSASEGTVVASGTFVSPAQSGVSTLVSISNGNSGESINIYRQNSVIQLSVYDNGGSPQAAWSVNPAPSNLTKAALAYKASDFGAAVNGTSQTSVTSGTLPTVDRMEIGRLWSGTFGANGWIRQITYLPRRLSNSELAARTV